MHCSNTSTATWESKLAHPCTHACLDLAGTLTTASLASTEDGAARGSLNLTTRPSTTANYGEESDGYSVNPGEWRRSACRGNSPLQLLPWNPRRRGYDGDASLR